MQSVSVLYPYSHLFMKTIQIMYRFILIHINKFDLFRKQDETALIT